MTLIDILIPTYNRADDLIQNLHHLKEEIAENNLQGKIQIIISDNFSTDQTKDKVQAFIAANSDIQIHYYRNDKNIGLEANVVAVFSKAISKYVLFCGDDDLVAHGYLSFCISSIGEHPDLGCIIPGLKSIDKKGNEVVGRIENFDFKVIAPGYDALLKYSHYAHQMSGLLLRAEGVLDSYLAKAEFRNPYLFIYFISINIYHHKSIYAPGFKTAVQVENEKDWGYNEIGLLDEVFKSYFYFRNILGEEKWTELLLYFIRMHSYRLSIDPFNPFALKRKALILKNFVKLNKKLARKIDWLLFKEYILSFKKTKLK